MSTALAHFSFGAACALLVLTLLPVRSRYTHTVVILSGIWAMIPDVWRVSPVFEGVLRWLGDSVLANLFWFHGLFDRVDAGDSQPFAAVMLGIYLLATVLYTARQRDQPVFAWTWGEGSDVETTAHQR